MDRKIYLLKNTAYISANTNVSGNKNFDSANIELTANNDQANNYNNYV
jgi:hypothetical protein